jgi:chemotaxis protein histidine kinase CheA
MSAGKIAHTIKSSAAQLGLAELADICKRMEAKGLEGIGEQTWQSLYVEFESKMNDSLLSLPSAPGPDA